MFEKRAAVPFKVPQLLIMLLRGLAASVTISAEEGQKNDPDDPFAAVVATTAEDTIAAAIATAVIVIASAEEE